MKYLMIFLVLLLIILQYKLWVQNGGIVATMHLKHAVAKQEKDNQKLYKQNEKLAKQIYYLKHTKKSVEAIAREQLGMVKKGETYYQMINTPTKEDKQDIKNENTRK